MTWKDDWKFLLDALFKPGPVIFIFLAIACLIISLIFSDKVSVIIMSVLGNVFTGIAGGFVFHSWQKATGQDALVKKGRSAIRGLLLTRDSIDNVLSRMDEDASPEEVKNLVNCLSAEVSNSVQEWIDIVPEVADIEQIYNKRKAALKQVIDIYENLAMGNKEKSEQIETLKQQIVDLRRREKELQLRQDPLALALSDTSRTNEEHIGRLKKLVPPPI